MKKWLAGIATSVTTFFLMAPIALADGETGSGLVDPNQFKVNTMMGTGLGNFFAKILAQVLFLVFEVAVVVALGMLAWNLVLLLVGKKSRQEVGQDLFNKVAAIFALIIILSGGGATVLNLMTQTASTTIDSANAALQEQMGDSSGGQ